MFRIALVALATLSVGETVFAHTDAPPVATTRTASYKSAQGVIDLTKIEAMMSDRLGEKVEVVSMRWSHDPLDYVDYIFGGIRSATPHFEEFQVATYVLNVRVAEEHEATCLVQLRVNMNTGRISTCESKTARVIFFKDFEYGDIGLPGKPVTKRWYPNQRPADSKTFRDTKL